MDPSQDLLVLVERRAPRSMINTHPPFRVHLHTLSTNLPHPRAKFFIIEQSIVPFVDVGYSLRLQVMEDTIGVFFKADRAPGSPPSLFVVWQWTTGFVRSMMSFTHDTPESFSFLSLDEFVLPRILPNILSGNDDHPPSLEALFEIYSMHNHDLHPLYPRPTREVIFLLPPMVAYLDIAGFKSCSNPAPTWASAPPCLQPSPSSIPQRSHHPFHVASQSRIISFSIMTQAARAVRLFLITYASTLLSYTRFLPSLLPPTHSRRIPWEDWGLVNTRWIEGSFNFGAYECYVFGNRFVHGVATGDDDLARGKCSSVRVLDFNKFAVGRPTYVGGADDGEDNSPLDGGAEGSDSGDDTEVGESVLEKVECRTVTATSVIPGGLPFLADVYSSLPYREITKRVSHPPFRSVMIDDERIICKIGDGNVWVHTI